MLHTRICALEGCGVEFQTDNKIKKHCCPTHSTLSRVRRLRAKRRKGGGGGGGGGNGGGGHTLFDTITPVDSRAIYAPDTSYRTPEQEPARKPAIGVTEKSNKAAA